MTRIAGLFYPDACPADVLAAEIDAMLSAYSPNGQRDIFISDRAAFGVIGGQVARLGENAAVADAFLINRADLCRQFDVDPRTPTADLILRAYQVWGEECAAHLDGNFAFAIWDAKEQKLICGRDRFGARPLFMTNGRPNLAFASEIKALRPLAWVADDLDEEVLASMLADVTGVLIDSENTLIRVIDRLSPATLLVARASVVQEHRYWQLDPQRETRFATDDEYADAFMHHFREAVSACVDESRPITAQLSGGLDSSSVVAVARSLMSPDTPLHTFYSRSALPARDERGYITALIDHLSAAGTPINHHDIDEPPPFADFERILAIHDEPPISANPAVFYRLYRAAGEHAGAIMIDGDDGDTTVSHGLGLLNQLAFSGAWDRFFAEAGALAGRTKQPNAALHAYFKRYGSAALHGMTWREGWKASGEIAPFLRASRLRVMSDHVVRPRIPSSTRRAVRRVLRRTDPPPALDNPTLNPDFIHKWSLHEWMGYQRRSMQDDERRDMPERARHIRALQLGAHPVILEENDRLAHAHGVEARHPFRDRRLVEFCVSLPAEVKLRMGWSRWILRRSMEGILPPTIQWRRDKTNFSPSINHGMLTANRELVEAVVFGDVGRSIETYIDRATLQNIYRTLIAAQPYETLHHSQRMEYAARSVRKAVTLALWLNRMGAKR